MRKDNLLKEVNNLHTLAEVLQWAFTRRPAADLVNVLTQDEFTHDVVISVSQDHFLVFDTN